MRRYAIVLLVVVLIPGCGLLSLLPWYTPDDGDPTGSAKLMGFESKEELSQYFADQIGSRNEQFGAPGGFDWRSEGIALDADDAGGAAGEATGSEDVANAPPSADSGDSTQAEGGGGDSTDIQHSDTTIQEEGVDEADVVKTDGTYLYIISDDILRIVRAYPPEELALVSEVELEGWGREIYLHDGKIVAITETYGGPVFVDGAVSLETEEMESDVDVSAAQLAVEYVYERPKTIVTVIDASTPSAPNVLTITKLDGSSASSRMIDGVLRLVLANYQDHYYNVLPLLGQPELDLQNVEVETLLPRFEQTDAMGAVTSGASLGWQEMYRPTDPDGFGVVSVVTMDVDGSGAFKAVGVVAEPGLIYSSLNALYLTDTEWDFSGSTRATTDIYKFKYTEDDVIPVASGSVPGRVLNQYSMGEYEGYLRVATTIDSGFSLFSSDGPVNAVFVLGGVGNELEVVGSVEGIAPRETIQAARFVGDRGYVVTFEQIDPLFTLDLSDPTDPRIVGELKVPGFSTFVVPMDEDHLLTVGRYIPEVGAWWGWGVQLSIFNVSDFANPFLEHNVVIGEGGEASSDALWDPKAFTYFAEGGLVALPVQIYGESIFFWDEEDIVVGNEGGVVTVSDSSPTEPEEPVDSDGDDDDEPVEPDEPIIAPEPYWPQDEFVGLIVYSVNADDGFAELGRISTRFEESGTYWSSFTRGVFIGEDVYAVTDHGVRAAPLSDVNSAPYELPLEGSVPLDTVTSTVEALDSTTSGG